MRVEIDRKWCKGCAICIQACKFGVLELGEARSDRGYLMPRPARPEACTGCGMCERFCPDLCIDVKKEVE